MIASAFFLGPRAQEKVKALAMTLMYLFSSNVFATSGQPEHCNNVRNMMRLLARQTYTEAHMQDHFSRCVKKGTHAKIRLRCKPSVSTMFIVVATTSTAALLLLAGTTTLKSVASLCRIGTKLFLGKSCPVTLPLVIDALD